MHNTPAPAYDFKESSPNVWFVDVHTNLSQSVLNEAQRIQILYDEAEKSPLFAMALVQKLANEGDEFFKAIQSLYQSYREFLIHQSVLSLQIVSKNILASNRQSQFLNDCAIYILGLISQPNDLQINEAKTLLNKLIPGFEKTLTASLLHKHYEEQEVYVPEMNVSTHRAFPDLIKFEGIYYAAYREGKTHANYEDLGVIRILKGVYNPIDKSWNWKNMDLLTHPNYDLRDPKFFINHENQLQLIIGGTHVSEKNEVSNMVPHITILDNGKWKLEKAVTDPSADGLNGQWIWRITWNSYDNYGYGFCYAKEAFSLVKTADGKTFEKVTDIACEPLMGLTEGTIRFKNDGTAVALLRSKKNGVILNASPKDGYRIWNYMVVPFRVGGPNFLFSQDESTLWAATRHFFLLSNNELDEATIVASMREDELIPLLRLKSKYDNSYPGMVLEDDGSMTILYYSSNVESNSFLYITRVGM